MPYPCTAGELQEFLCAANWMRDSIIDFARTVEPLQAQLDSALGSGKRTKRVAAGISIMMTDTERQAFDSAKAKLATLA
jgi:hypothetical protein